MSSLFGRLSSQTGSNDAFIKKSIVTQLSDSVKEIQLFGIEENLSGDLMNIGEASNTLCTIIEALFLHGLKDSLVGKAKRVVSGDVDHRPDSNFWAPLLIFSHRQIIDQISQLSNITTEIGQCRAWVRIALNDGLLASYLSSFIQDNSALKPFYKTSAYVRDTEMLDVARHLIEGVEIFTVFKLPCNSSLLNSWFISSLYLAGIWSPPLRQCPIYSGVDVAQSLDNCSDATPVALDISDLCGQSSGGLGGMLALNEDEALQIILSDASKAEQAVNTNSVAPPACNANGDSVATPRAETNDREVEQRPSSLGNSLCHRTGWSQHVDTSVTPGNVVTSDGTRSMENSYHALIQSYNLVSANSTSADPSPERGKEEVNSAPNSSSSSSSSFSQLSLDIDDLQTQQQLQLRQLGSLAQEKGLDVQNFECFGCKHPLGINLCKARVCAFTGDCFCDGCMSPEPRVIPARVVHNWDLRAYHVSKQADAFLREVHSQPLLDLRHLNPHVYAGVEEVGRLHAMRVQLNILRDYLHTCRQPVMQQFQDLVRPREYLYEHTHQYSIADLLAVPDGSLAGDLHRAVSFGREHVLGCWLCSQKGFVCEVCRDPKTLYPFDTESTYRCEVCKAVYHTTCLDAAKPCPKCERRRHREDPPLLF